MPVLNACLYRAIIDADKGTSVEERSTPELPRYENRVADQPRRRNRRGLLLQPSFGSTPGMGVKTPITDRGANAPKSRSLPLSAGQCATRCCGVPGLAVLSTTAGGSVGERGALWPAYTSSGHAIPRNTIGGRRFVPTRPTPEDETRLTNAVWNTTDAVRPGDR